jgi:nucleoside 2-deoxyribosyltransferase
MQFSNEYNELFEEVIKPVTEKFGYECIRADEYYTRTPILSDIINSIKDSTAIIAEITPDNPNVFYEIGYSHAIGKPTILLCDKKREKLPFDLSGFRTLFYENTIAGKKKVETSLMKYLENI